VAVRGAYDAAYTRFYDRPMPGSDVEIMSFSVQVTTAADRAPVQGTPVASCGNAAQARTQAVRDIATGEVAEWAVFERSAVPLGAIVVGPAIIAEDETSTLVGRGWTAIIDRFGYIDMSHQEA
ncbi:MAG: hydantoinase/oxoprolinase family protein, partial [Pseudomonadota bacterium]|nr:hydantoinase/oxoprolinase family protein [Pseudomonadota bacterium]